MAELTGDRPPRVSAILAVRDAGPGLPDALERIRATLSDDDELVIVDDGSTDGTDAVLRDTDWRGLRTMVLSSTGRGVAAARNLALGAAGGEVVWFIDWDDLWDTRIVEILYAAWTASGAPVVGCGADAVTPAGRRIELLGTVAQPTLLTGGQIGVAILDGRLRGYLWNKLFARDVLGAAPFPDVRTRSDFAGTAELMAGLPSVYLLPDLLFHHVRRPGSLTMGQPPSLATLRRSLQVGSRVADLARTHPADPAEERDVAAAQREFTYREWHLALADAAVRARLDPATRDTWLRLAREGMRLHHLPHLVRRDPWLAVRATALTVAGTRYPRLHRSAARLRARARKPDGGR